MSDAKLSFKTVDFQSPAYHKTVALRDELLRKPLGLQFSSEDFAREKYDYHLALVDEKDEPLACLILTPIDEKNIKMRQVAVKESIQGRGIGRQLLSYAEEFARKKGFQMVFCHAREGVIPFYQKLGYRISGEPFTEVGIRHFRMEKDL